MREAANAQTDGLLFAAGINRLVYFRDLFQSQPEEVVVRQNFHQQFYRMEMLIQSMHRHSAMDI